MEVNYSLNTNTDEEIEDVILACAIEQGLNTETVSKKVLINLLNED
ncbi:MAG: hypothetical protein WAX77_06915 [Methylococcaceae bacterium]